MFHNFFSSDCPAMGNRASLEKPQFISSAHSFAGLVLCEVHVYKETLRLAREFIAFG